MSSYPDAQLRRATPDAQLKTGEENKETFYNPFDMQKDGCDVVIKVNDHVMYLHESILSLYSPVFENMLTDECMENEQIKVVCVKDKKIEHLVELFKYFYPDKLQVTNGKRYLSPWAYSP